jgi:hypothetical protein
MKLKNKRYAAEGKFARPLKLVADPVVFSNDQELSRKNISLKQ